MALHDRIAISENLSEGFRAAASVYGTGIAQVFRTPAGCGPGTRTYAELQSAVCALASSLIEIGFPYIGRAGINSVTRPEWNIADMAVLACGGATVGIYTTDNADNIEHKAIDSGLSIIFTDNEQRLRQIMDLPKNIVPSLQHIISFDPVPRDISDARVLAFGDLISKSPDPGKVEKRISLITPQTSARIIYTSGTVGRAKGAVLTHSNLISNIISTSKVLEFREGDVSLSHLPSAHILQTMITNMTLFAGGTLAYAGKPTFDEDLRAARPTIFPGVPRVFAKLLDTAEKHLKDITGSPDASVRGDVDKAVASKVVEKLGLDRLRICISGAAKLDPEVAGIFESKFGITVLEGYGMSETSPVISVNTPECHRPGTVGKVIPGVEVKIVDEEGRERPAGIQGEIAVRGNNVFSGYLNLPVVNASVISRDGFFFTGDVGLLDHDDFLQIVGRKGSQVKFANGNYYDLEKIAEGFLEHTFLIRQAAAAGEQKNYPVAVVSLAEDLEVAVRYADSLGIEYKDPYELVYNDQIIEAVREEFLEIKNKTRDLHPMERVHKILYVRPFSPENGETTATGKIRMKKIFARYRDEIEKLYREESDFRVLKVSRRNL